MEQQSFDKPLVFGILSAFLVVVLSHSFWPAVVVGVGVGVVTWMGEK